MAETFLIVDRETTEAVMTLFREATARLRNAIAIDGDGIMAAETALRGAMRAVEFVEARQAPPLPCEPEKD